MNETTNQMSLLDAIGFSAPEKTSNGKANGTSPAEELTAKRKSKKRPAREVDASTQKAEQTRDHGNAEEKAKPAAEDFVERHDSENDPVSAALNDDDPLTLDNYICFALYSANHAMHGVYKALLKEAGLTYPQFLAMTVLWETNNVPVGTITSKLQLDTNTLTPLLKRLEAMGLVTRTRNSKDERQVILKLTRKGRALQKKTEHFSSCIFSATGLTADQIMDLQKKIMILRDNLRNHEVT